MLFQRVNRTDPEKIFIVAYNSWSTASLTNGQAVVWDYTTDIDGVGVSRHPSAGPGAHAGFAAAGIVAETIASGSYGLIQVYGYHSAVRVDAKGVYASADIAKGSPLALAPRAAGFNLTAYNCTASTVKLAFPCAFAFAAYTKSGTTAAIACFIKAL
jgi:hypothetical protein